MSVSSNSRHVLKKHLESSGSFEMTGKGTSMYPLIREGEKCYFETKGSLNKPGEIYLYSDENNRFIVHRLIKVEKGQLYFKGDANLGMDPPVSPSQLLGRLVKVQKRKKWIEPYSSIWGMFGWILVRSKYIRSFNVRLSKKIE